MLLKLKQPKSFNIFNIYAVNTNVSFYVIVFFFSIEHQPNRLLASFIKMVKCREENKTKTTTDQVIENLSKLKQA